MDHKSIIVKENTSGLGLGLEVGGTQKNANGIVQVENRRRTVTYKIASEMGITKCTTDGAILMGTPSFGTDDFIN